MVVQTYEPEFLRGIKSNIRPGPGLGWRRHDSTRTIGKVFELGYVVLLLRSSVFRPRRFPASPLFRGYSSFAPGVAASGTCTVTGSITASVCTAVYWIRSIVADSAWACYWYATLRMILVWVADFVSRVLRNFVRALFIFR
jgi:hypothetical protein